MKILLLTICLLLLTACSTKLAGDVIPVEEKIIIEQPKVIPVLTTTQKATLSTLVTKSDATATSKNKMTYQEALQFLDAMNKYTVKRQFENVNDIKQVYMELKNELNTLTIK